ncbi:hypothetical protein SXCC_00055 [Gluconacetobacter sp. SXCC-1]|uniref:hypothetical protein n=1 Tax=Komagataeibacter rhaeticus TaxID=215221 RepID=UPI000207FDA6|nr:hypothetical protein [Komagataeibacter rhaeticus]EGG79277.1 hypothetical protein SXCC_00055 [Gluconacetobacter sp. SXCC-1]
MPFTPFDDQGESSTVGGLTVENGSDRIAVYGQMSITRDRRGLDDARALKDVLDAIVDALERQPDLPQEIGTGLNTHPVRNPFA